MSSIRSVFQLVRPYWRRALLALFFLTTLVFMDLTIPRLIQRIIDTLAWYGIEVPLPQFAIDNVSVEACIWAAHTGCQ